MSNIFSKNLKAQFSQGVCSVCKVDKCELKLNGFPEEIVILNVDNIIKPKQLGRRCDYVVIVDESNQVFFLPIEFKSSNLNFTKIKAQLESTVQFFKNCLPNQLVLYPVLVSRTFSRRQQKSLREIKVKSSFDEKRIRHVLCNKPLKWSEVKA